jgi:hypothetical protein
VVLVVVVDEDWDWGLIRRGKGRDRRRKDGRFRPSLALRNTLLLSPSEVLRKTIDDAIFH